VIVVKIKTIHAIILKYNKISYNCTINLFLKK
jgi:hypothetical protein